jgi:hypothetical protein
MKNYHQNDWIGEFIHNKDLSDEAIYAIYSFLERILTEFETKAFCRLRTYIQAQEEIHRNIPVP